MAGQTKVFLDHIKKAFSVKSREEGKSVTEVLEEVTFEVKDHEFVAIIGPSGCGKTTLLRIIHGLVRPDSGTVYLDGNPVTGPGYDRAMVFQDASLLPWRTALGNAVFGLELKGLPRSQYEEIGRHYLKLVGLAGFEGYHPHQLSGGMQQRVGLARALAIDPEVLLLDEPFGALDAQTREVLQGELIRIFAETRKTALFVTHDLDEAIYLADRLIVMGLRPARVIAEMDVRMPRPRDPDVKGSDTFLSLRRELWQLLKQPA